MSGQGGSGYGGYGQNAYGQGGFQAPNGNWGSVGGYAPTAQGPMQQMGAYGYGMNYGQPMGNPWWQGQQYAMPNPYSGLLGLFSQLQQQKAMPRTDMGGSGNYASLGGGESIVQQPGAVAAPQNFASPGGEETLAPVKKVVAPLNYEYGGGI